MGRDGALRRPQASTPTADLPRTLQRGVPTSQIEQLQLARHLRRDRRGMTVRSADRRDIGRRQTRCRRDEIMVREHAVRPAHRS